MRNLTIPHEPAPDVSRPQVLRAQQHNAHVDSDHVAINPTGVWIKGINKAVHPIHALTIFFAHCSQSSDGDFRSQHQRPTGGRWNYGSVDLRIARWATPGEITLDTIRSCDTPDVFLVAGKFGGKRKAEGTMCQGGIHGVLKIVDLVASGSRGGYDNRPRRERTGA